MRLDELPACDLTMSSVLDVVVLQAQMAIAAPTTDLRKPAADEGVALLDAAREGDTVAFGCLVERHQRDVYRLCFRFVNDRDDAADLTQEVFLRAYRAIRSFRGESAFSTWLYRIAVNLCQSFRASRRPHDELTESSVVVGGGEVLDRIERRERIHAVRDAVARLPAKQRATLVLKVYHELTHEQVAEVLGTSVGTAKANLFHALANLRRLLGVEGARS
jgi:RNA polymerase sigma-70 factor (ECF subfamily)